VSGQDVTPSEARGTSPEIAGVDDQTAFAAFQAGKRDSILNLVAGGTRP
jgi:hypothetical protein